MMWLIWLLLGTEHTNKLLAKTQKRIDSRKRISVLSLILLIASLRYSEPVERKNKVKVDHRSWIALQNSFKHNVSVRLLDTGNQFFQDTSSIISYYNMNVDWNTSNKSLTDRVTIVTAFIDIGGFQKGHVQRSTSAYRQWLSIFSRMTNPIVAYFDSEDFANYFSRVRSSSKLNLTTENHQSV